MYVLTLSLKNLFSVDKAQAYAIIREVFSLAARRAYLFPPPKPYWFNQPGGVEPPVGVALTGIESEFTSERGCLFGLVVLHVNFYGYPM